MYHDRTYIDCGPNWINRLEQDADSAIRLVREATGIPIYGAMTTEGVLYLVQMCGYTCDPDRLRLYLADGKVPMPEPFGNDLIWSNDLIAALMRALHNDRCWLPCLHTSFKNQAERAVDEKIYQQCVQTLALYETYGTYELEQRLQAVDDCKTINIISSVLRERYGNGKKD